MLDINHKSQVPESFESRDPVQFAKDMKFTFHELKGAMALIYVLSTSEIGMSKEYDRLLDLLKELSNTGPILDTTEEFVTPKLDL